MRKFLLVYLLSCIAMVSTLEGQCSFPTYDSYGLICDEARFLCGFEMDGYQGKLLSEKSPLPQPDPLCAGTGEADNIQWFSFVANDSILEIVIRYSDCTGNVLAPGLQVGIYENCDLAFDNTPLGSLYCEEGQNYGDIVLKPDSSMIEIGQLYLLFVDGYAGSACDFEIEIIQGICTDAPGQSQPCEQDCGVFVQFPDNASCTGFTDEFKFVPSSQIIEDVFGCNPAVDNTQLDSIICVEWEIIPNTGFEFVSTSFEYFNSVGIVSTLNVKWTDPGTYTIKPILNINPLFSTCQQMCICSDNIAYTIDISQSTLTQFPTIELCPDECGDFCGQTQCGTGDLYCYDRDQCLIEVQPYVQKPEVFIDLGENFICSGDCFEFQNTSYCIENDYEITDTAFCDTTYLLQLKEIELSVLLAQGTDLINCDIPEVNLVGSWNTNFSGNIISAWISEDGDTLTWGTNYSTSDAGDYTFVAWPDGYRMCEVSFVHGVTKNVAVPSASLTSPILDCNNSAVTIGLSSQDDLLSAEWTGPNGFVSSDFSPIVAEAGNYELVLTAINGCQISLATEVEEDFEIPELEVTYDNLTCSENIPVSMYSSSADILSQVWKLPDGSSSNDEVLAINGVGNYSVEITAVNGCSASYDFEVVDLSYDPSLNLNEDRIWRCNDTEVVLDLASHFVSDLKYVWTSLEGGFIANTIDLTITKPGVYILTIEDESVECVGRDTVRIIEDPNPFVDVNVNTYSPRCTNGVDGKIEIDIHLGGEGPYTYSIDGVVYPNLDEIEFTAGVYDLNVVDAFGCEVSKPIEIIDAPDFNVSLEETLEIRFGQNKTIGFETTLEDNEIGLIEWTNDSGEILSFDRDLDFKGEEIDFINLRVENLNGCEIEKRILVDLSYEVDIYYPNIFSPDNDGENDLFILYNNGFPEMADDLKIFDRSGELIYTSSQTQFNDKQAGWDGTFNGSPCQPGVYVFILEYTLRNGRAKTLSGTVTLLR
ncbi:MAG: gliding motility-associated C-terminal domain-containing protein [Saprospiraceae bacterium]|nr:gliding motility-associated C-terminal domain-containing protein [Saprospiraceae bacterium]